MISRDPETDFEDDDVWLDDEEPDAFDEPILDGGNDWEHEEDDADALDEDC